MEHSTDCMWSTLVLFASLMALVLIVGEYGEKAKSRDNQENVRIVYK